MYIVVYPDKPAEYVPDILFEDGTYKSPEDYVERMRALDARFIREREEEALKESKSKKSKSKKAK